MGEIEFDFCVAGHAKNQIEEAANRVITEVLPEMEELMEEISLAWKGESGNQFQELIRQENSKAEQTAEHLKYADLCIQDAILMANQIEEKAKEIAEFRTY